MDTPTSDVESNGSVEPSEPSMPTTPVEPFEPQYRVRVSDPVKDGEYVKYTVRTSLTRDGGKDYKVIRTFEDFEWLHHCLMTQNDTTGIIAPPLPFKPVVEAKQVEKKSQQQLGNASKQLMGDDFSRDCKALEKYMRLMISHHLFGKDPMIHSFLTEKDPPIRTRIKKGIFEKFSSKMESMKMSHKDIDEYFQQERDQAANRVTLLSNSSNAFSKTLDSQRRIFCLYGHLATALRLVNGAIEGDMQQGEKAALVKLGEALEDAKHGAEVDVANDANSMGFQLDLAHRYAEALKEMLFRRTCLLVAYEDSNKALAKAKPNKKSEAEEHKKIAEQLFEECSETARKELQTFHRQQVVFMQEALCVYAEAKIKTARDTYALLAKSLSAVKQMPI